MPSGETISPEPNLTGEREIANTKLALAFHQGLPPSLSLPSLGIPLCNYHHRPLKKKKIIPGSKKACTPC